MTAYRFSTLAYVLLSGQHGPFRVRDNQDRHTVWDVYADHTTLDTWEDVAEVLSDDDAELQIKVPGTSWSDNDSDLDRANWIALQDDFPGLFSVEDYWDGHALWVDAIIVDTDETPLTAIELDHAVSLAEGLAGLRDDYPLWSDEAHSALEQTLAEEAWDAWLASDVDSVIVDAAIDTPAADYLDMITGQSLYEPFWTLYQDAERNYPYAESATSIVIPEWEETARDLAKRFVDGWRPGMPLFPCVGCGEEMYSSYAVTRHGDACPQQTLPLAV